MDAHVPARVRLRGSAAGVVLRAAFWPVVAGVITLMGSRVAVYHLRDAGADGPVFGTGAAIGLAILLFARPAQRLPVMLLITAGVTLGLRSTRVPILTALPYGIATAVVCGTAAFLIAR